MPGKIKIWHCEKIFGGWDYAINKAEKFLNRLNLKLEDVKINTVIGTHNDLVIIIFYLL